MTLDWTVPADPWDGGADKGGTTKGTFHDLELSPAILPVDRSVAEGRSDMVDSESMRICGKCGGPTARCFACRHHHCDDTTCEGMPVLCAQAADEADREEGALRGRDYEKWADL